MTKKINTKFAKIIKYYNLINYNLIYENQSINRYKNKDLIDLNLSQKWDKIRDFRLQVTNALEEKGKLMKLDQVLMQKLY